jgi:hypothetical protein
MFFKHTISSNRLIAIRGDSGFYGRLILSIMELDFLVCEYNTTAPVISSI